MRHKIFSVILMLVLIQYPLATTTFSSYFTLNSGMTHSIWRMKMEIWLIFNWNFSLEVQPLTKFPKPADCLPLFRFGFDLQPEVWEYFLMTDKTKILVNERVQCGFPGITKFHCVAIRGCCFDDESGMQLLSLTVSLSLDITRVLTMQKLEFSKNSFQNDLHSRHPRQP